MAQELPPGLVDVLEADRVEKARVDRFRAQMDDSARTSWRLDDVLVSEDTLVAPVAWNGWTLTVPATMSSFVTAAVARHGFATSRYSKEPGFARMILRCMAEGPSTPHQAMWAAVSTALAGDGPFAGKQVDVLSFVNPDNGIFIFDVVAERTP